MQVIGKPKLSLSTSGGKSSFHSVITATLLDILSCLVWCVDGWCKAGWYVPSNFDICRTLSHKETFGRLPKRAGICSPERLSLGEMATRRCMGSRRRSWLLCVILFDLRKEREEKAEGNFLARALFNGFPQGGAAACRRGFPYRLSAQLPSRLRINKFDVWARKLQIVTTYREHGLDDCILSYLTSIQLTQIKKVEMIQLQGLAV